jgi:hypothetical protein
MLAEPDHSAHRRPDYPQQSRSISPQCWTPAIRVEPEDEGYGGSKRRGGRCEGIWALPSTCDMGAKGVRARGGPQLTRSGKASARAVEWARRDAKRERRASKASCISRASPIPRRLAPCRHCRLSIFWPLIRIDGPWLCCASSAMVAEGAGGARGCSYHSIPNLLLRGAVSDPLTLPFLRVALHTYRY